MTNLTGGGLLAKTLQAAGVTEVFSLHGGHLDSFLIACKDHGIRLTDTRHEASAGHLVHAAEDALGECVFVALRMSDRHEVGALL